MRKLMSLCAVLALSFLSLSSAQAASIPEAYEVADTNIRVDIIGPLSNQVELGIPENSDLMLFTDTLKGVHLDGFYEAPSNSSLAAILQSLSGAISPLACEAGTTSIHARAFQDYQNLNEGLFMFYCATPNGTFVHATGVLFSDILAGNIRYWQMNLLPGYTTITGNIGVVTK